MKSINHGDGMRSSVFLFMIALAALVAGCGPSNPGGSSPTSGKLIVYADEIYAPLIRALADTFMVKSPNARVEVRPLSARKGVQSLFDSPVHDTTGADTMATTAIVIGRKLFPDEQQASLRGGFEVNEYVIGYDGFAVVVPNGSPLHTTTMERLRAALSGGGPAGLDSAGAGGAVRFLLTDQNSSAFAFMRSVLLHDSNVTAPAQYISTSDSLLKRVAAGDGIGLLGWFAAHRDSAAVRTLAIGFTDSTRTMHPPAIIHPASLVTGIYPMKQPLVGYTFASSHSLAVGFLAWLSKSQDAQSYLVNHGLQGENIKLRISMPEEGP
ncbi:MAG: phosphate-binding protein [Chlorobi bacterium]|nr:phosphate-binding protein [Chlorobiota bacterium]